MKKLDEMDLLRLKSIDLEGENLINAIELARFRVQESNSRLREIQAQRNAFIEEIKTKYKIDGQFNYDRQTGEIKIIESKPEAP